MENPAVGYLCCSLWVAELVSAMDPLGGDLCWWEPRPLFVECSAGRGN